MFMILKKSWIQIRDLLNVGTGRDLSLQNPAKFYFRQDV